jgi:hypothetical protein
MSAFTEDEIKGIERLTLEEAWAEIKRMRPVVEAAQKWRRYTKTKWLRDCERPLAKAVDEYE